MPHQIRFNGKWNGEEGWNGLVVGQVYEVFMTPDRFAIAETGESYSHDGFHEFMPLWDEIQSL